MAEQATETLSVKVRTNGDVKNVPYTANMTVRDAVQAAGLATKWKTKYFVNGVNARSSSVMNPGDMVTLSPRIRNGG